MLPKIKAVNQKTLNYCCSRLPRVLNTKALYASLKQENRRLSDEISHSKWSRFLDQIIQPQNQLFFKIFNVNSIKNPFKMLGINFFTIR